MTDNDRKDRCRNLSTVLQSEPLFRRYAKIADERPHQSLVDGLASALPQHLAPHVTPLSLRNRRLTVACDPALATELRFLEPQLLQQLRSVAIISSLQIQLKAAPSAETAPSSELARKMPGKTAKELIKLAESIDHPELEASLKKLAARADQKAN